MISNRDSGTAGALYLNLFDSKQMVKQGGERGGCTKSELQKMKISGVEEHDTVKGGCVCDQQGEGHHWLTHRSLQSSFISARSPFLSFFHSRSVLGTLRVILTAVQVGTL